MAFQSSRASRFRSAAKELLCGHGERPILRTSSTKDNTGRRFWGCVYYEVQDSCDFFRWADPEPGSVQEEVEIARNRRKITKLKTRLKEVETKLWVVAALCIAGWVRFLFLLLQNQYNLKHPNGMHLVV
ncbi:DNA-(Apurinic or apyrimidinic site) lyase 2-like [Arachis hypogaea]|nr:DNA-(Apurinic or apyrimidinic site) lyase 2-like [Arachis hypogaea]